MPLLEEIWSSGQLTNGGPMHQRLEAELAATLNVKYVSLFCNGTIALLAALKALNVSGEVITTPFSFVATSHSLIWNACTPVFVDIDPTTLNIDARKIESSITPNTSAILAVHCYGTPCDVDEIERVAKRHKLRVIYDAAHAFGVECHCGSVLNHGDASVLSFHATKSFNTFEGGAVISHTRKMKLAIDDLKNFGFRSETEVETLGVNGKLNELQAAIGLLNLTYYERNREQRKLLSENYDKKLAGLQGVTPALSFDNKPLKANYTYYPIRVEATRGGMSRDSLYENLKQKMIFTRRYFYPLIPDFSAYRTLPYVMNDLPVARKTAQEILCLPLYYGLTTAEQDRVIEAIYRSIGD